MLTAYARHWWLMVLRGVAAMIFGILALVVPGAALFALLILFGIYALVDGILAVAAALRTREANRLWWVLLLEGLAGIVAGVLAFLLPGLTALTLLFIIAFWALFTGVMEIIAAFRLRREITNEWALALSGVISVVLGILILINPGAGLIGLIWAIGIYAIVFGLLEIYLGFRVRGGARHVTA